jgi:hypothetical protein
MAAAPRRSTIWDLLIQAGEEVFLCLSTDQAPA